MPNQEKKHEVDLCAFPGSHKVYVEGSRPDIQVPMREITLSRTSGTAGEAENAPVRVYDTSGPYTNDEAYSDIRKGLTPHRLQWIAEREMPNLTKEERSSRRITGISRRSRRQRCFRDCSVGP